MMSAKATKNTISRRRSSRIESKQKQEAEKAKASKEKEVKEDEQVSDHAENETFKMKLRNHSSDNAKEQDMVNLKGDIHTKYTDHDCVWAKYLDYPWWPGQVEIDSTTKRGRKRTKTVTVRWFGKGLHEQVNNCKLAMVVPWDPDELNRIIVEVREEDTKCFQDAVDECNDMYLKICQERGEQPVKAAAVFAEQQQERENWTMKSSPKAKKAIPKASPAAQNKTKRKRGRQRKDSTASSAPSQSESKQNVTKSPPKNKRGRKRKHEEAMNGDHKPETELKEKTEDEASSEKAKAKEKELDNEQEKENEKENKGEKEDEDDEDIDVQKKKVVGVRRSARANKKQQVEEEEDNNAEIAGYEKYTHSECQDNLNAAFAKCTAMHSASDFTPWIALFYFGMRTYSKLCDTDGDFINTVANTFQLEEEQVSHHLSEFVETQSGNPPKKRRKNTD